MNDPRGSGQAAADRSGLCGSCAHVRIVTSGKGARFYLCRRSLTDPRFLRYPPLPVLVCTGYQHEPNPHRDSQD
ncbi:MAG: hypothetical protein ABJC89_15310 [Acidobacteriota bacterium]